MTDVETARLSRSRGHAELLYVLLLVSSGVCVALGDVQAAIFEMLLLIANLLWDVRNTLQRMDRRR